MILAFIMSLNVILFLFQVSADGLSDNAPTIFNYEDSLLKSYDAGNQTVTQDVELPSAEGQVSSDTGNIFTDMFSTAKNWIVEKTGLRYVQSFVTAFPNLLKTMGFPPEVSFALGVLWHALSLFILIGWLLGRI